MFNLFVGSSGLKNRNEGAVQMLREKKVGKYTAVYTADGEHLGEVGRLHHRPADTVHPGLKLFGSYLEVFNLAFGNPLFIPTDYIGNYADGKLTLSVSLTVVENETWDRTPDFVTNHTGKSEELV
jgi:hypothetical protein